MRDLMFDFAHQSANPCARPVITDHDLTIDLGCFEVIAKFHWLGESEGGGHCRGTAVQLVPTEATPRNRSTDCGGEPRRGWKYYRFCRQCV